MKATNKQVIYFVIALTIALGSMSYVRFAYAEAVKWNLNNTGNIGPGYTNLQTVSGSSVKPVAGSATTSTMINGTIPVWKLVVNPVTGKPYDSFYDYITAPQNNISWDTKKQTAFQDSLNNELNQTQSSPATKDQILSITKDLPISDQNLWLLVALSFGLSVPSLQRLIAKMQDYDKTNKTTPTVTPVSSAAIKNQQQILTAVSTPAVLVVDEMALLKSALTPIQQKLYDLLKGLTNIAGVVSEKDLIALVASTPLFSQNKTYTTDYGTFTMSKDADVNTLFTGFSFVAKSIDNYMKSYGKNEPVAPLMTTQLLLPLINGEDQKILTMAAQYGKAYESAGTVKPNNNLLDTYTFMYSDKMWSFYSGLMNQMNTQSTYMQKSLKDTVAYYLSKQTETLTQGAQRGLAQVVTAFNEKRKQSDNATPPATGTPLPITFTQITNPSTSISTQLTLIDQQISQKQQEQQTLTLKAQAIDAELANLQKQHSTSQIDLQKLIAYNSNVNAFQGGVSIPAGAQLFFKSTTPFNGYNTNTVFGVFADGSYTAYSNQTELNKDMSVSNEKTIKILTATAAQNRINQYKSQFNQLLEVQKAADAAQKAKNQVEIDRLNAFITSINLTLQQKQQEKLNLSTQQQNVSSQITQKTEERKFIASSLSNQLVSLGVKQYAQLPTPVTNSQSIEPLLLHSIYVSSALGTIVENKKADGTYESAMIGLVQGLKTAYTWTETAKERDLRIQAGQYINSRSTIIEPTLEAKLSTYNKQFLTFLSKSVGLNRATDISNDLALGLYQGRSLTSIIKENKWGLSLDIVNVLITLASVKALPINTVAEAKLFIYNAFREVNVKVLDTAVEAMNLGKGARYSAELTQWKNPVTKLFEQKPRDWVHWFDHSSELTGLKKYGTIDSISKLNAATQKFISTLSPTKKFYQAMTPDGIRSGQIMVTDTATGELAVFTPYQDGKNVIQTHFLPENFKSYIDNQIEKFGYKEIK